MVYLLLSFSVSLSFIFLQFLILQMIFPFGVLAFFFSWYLCLPQKSIAKSTVKEASIQVGFVWLFETIVTSALKPLDCSNGKASGKLIMDPTLPCPLGGSSVGSAENVGIAVFGLFVLVAYVVAPYLCLCRNRSFGFCGGCFSNLHTCYQGQGCCVLCTNSAKCSHMRVGGLVGKFYIV